MSQSEPPRLAPYPPDITLIASVVGESAISHGIGGIDIPAKMALLTKS